MSGGEHILRNVSFGPAWEDDSVQLTHKGWSQITDGMAKSIVRLECENDELRAEVAMLQEQARIITEERDEARIQYRSTEALGMALVKTINELKAEVQSYRADACRESCRDKEAADRIGRTPWSNI